MDNTIKLMDMHNHTVWSDGVNSTLELVKDAISRNIQMIGFTDHFNTSKCPSLAFDELDSYIAEINLLKQHFYNSIQIYKGVEINPFPFPKSFKNLPYNEFHKLDYILIEYLDFLSSSIKLKDIEQYIKKFNCPVGLAHTDLFKLEIQHKNEGGLDYILDFLEGNNIFWEINSNLAYESFDDIIYNSNKKHINILFEKIKKRNIKVTVGSDKHSKDDFELTRFTMANNIAYSINLNEGKINL